MADIWHLQRWQNDLTLRRSLHFLTELGCEMLADNAFVAYIKQQKNPSF